MISILHKKIQILFALFISCGFILSSCDKNRVFEKNTDIDNYQWGYLDTISFEFEIQNSSVGYNVFSNVRHTFYYNWSNIWLNWELISPDSSFVKDVTNIPLAKPSGDWFGSCSGDICNYQYPIIENFIFPDTGKYQFNVVQEMRENPLPNIMSIGLRIEKIETDG